MRIVCWVTKATATHSEYVTSIAFARKQWLHERALTFRYTCIICLVIKRKKLDVMRAYVDTGLDLQLWAKLAFRLDCDKARIISKFVLPFVSDFISLHTPMWYHYHRRACKLTE